MVSTDPENIIIVPINVQAICIGTEDAKQPAFIKRNADFSLLPWREGNRTYNEYANISEHVLNSPFESDRQSLPQGIHLHWALPDAFTHAEIRNSISLSDFQSSFPDDAQAIWGQLTLKKWLIPFPTAKSLTANFNDISLLPTADQTLDGELKPREQEINLFIEQHRMYFPNVPNRWLITRLTGNIQRCWVIESDSLSTVDVDSNGLRKSNTTVPFQSDVSSKPYRYMGERFDYPQWEPNQRKEYYPKLTAIGYGDVEFAGYYPNCNSVFGFHDALDDVNDVTGLMYQIFGWYSDTNDFTKDPFQKSSDTASLLSKFNWNLPDSATIAHSIYSGIVSLEWDLKKKYLSTDLLVKVDTAFAPNEKEALSALGTDKNQMLFNAWQMGIEQQLDEPEGLFEINRDLHKSRFIKKDGGQLWNVSHTDQTNGISAHVDEKELPPKVGKQLAIVNKYQESYNVTSSKILSMRQRLFADWYKYMVRKYDLIPVQEMDTAEWQAVAFKNITLSEIQEYLEETNQKALNDLISELKALALDLSASLAELEKIMKGTLYTAGRTSSPFYYQGNDPTILFKSNLPEAQWEYAGDRNEVATDLLQCRLASEILSVPGEKTPKQLPDGEAPFHDILNALLIEGALFGLDPLYEYLTGRPATGEYKGVKEDLESGNLEGQMPEKISVTELAGNNPWLIMQLHWKVDYSALKPQGEGPYQPTYITGNFDLNPEQSELELITDSVSSFEKKEVLKGKCLLTAQAKANFTEQIDRCIEKYQDEELLVEKLKSVKESVSGSSILSQALTGFNDALVMNKQTLQLKVNDPLRAVFDDAFNELIQNTVSDGNSVAPLPHNTYNPIRAGLVRVNKMRLVGAFGRFKDVDISDVAYPDEMKLANPIGNYTALLPPRITQPSRLLFDYLDAASEEASEIIRYTGSNPVCGWIVLNMLDNAFMIYNQDGTPLGSLRTAPNDDSIIWQPTPGREVTSAKVEDDLKGANEYLRNFVVAISGKSTSFFEAFLRSLEDSQTFIQAGSYRHDQGLAPLIGEPIALVRANIRLQLQGLPEMNESWTALQKDMQSKNGLDRTTDEFAKVDFPMTVGSQDRHSDGLYGFFMGDQNFDTFYNEAIDLADYQIVKKTQITVSPDESDGITLSMLVQPINPVHLSSGILPEQSAEIPLEYCLDAINRLAVTFLTTPILIDNDEPRVPLSKEKGADWSFISKKADAWETAEDILDASNEATFMTSNRKLVEGWLQISPEEKDVP